jgi:predicted nuclease of predicted toxin-antitoxin system
VRFFLDHDVSAAVRHALLARGHECWTAAEAGLDLVADDELTVYAHDKRAVLVTHDREFSQRRRRNVVGQHLELRCNEWEAAQLLVAHLHSVESLTQAHRDVFIAMSAKGCEQSFAWE